jgi:hypothetical protein
MDRLARLSPARLEVSDVWHAVRGHGSKKNTRTCQIPSISTETAASGTASPLTSQPPMGHSNLL